ncbi:Predicted kinase [Amycolatopsis tolypomycina]|uniref:Predicted kinase n=1 Tax=Amycolatopsis tolypomycina TaxID=208445 RepID=A0A1H4JRR2_9PSEU|nr:AAA family ATPase [Amycolatopsis tolypomycina]SEB48666.1 Predicted kinase [Amycolatopsis tolypomycina]SEB49201.1 Predicted kinase [Amycolatopsis tolypomycina]
MRPTLYATIGPAGAGKTTWRHQHAPPGATVISLDERRSALSPCGCSADPSVNAAAVADGTADTRAVLAAGGTVVWDVTNYLPRFRAHLLDLAAEFDAATVGLVVLPPLLTVLARNGGRDGRICAVCGMARRVPDPVVWAMHAAITDALPGLHREGWHTLHFLSLPPYLHRRHHGRTP